MASLFAVTAFLGAAYPAGADTHIWHGSADLQWFNPANWTPSAVPGDGDDVEIGPNTGGSPLNRVILSADASDSPVDSIILLGGTSAQLLTNGFQLRVHGNGASSNTGRLRIEDSTTVNVSEVIADNSLPGLEAEVVRVGQGGTFSGFGYAMVNDFLDVLPGGTVNGNGLIELTATDGVGLVNDGTLFAGGLGPGTLGVRALGGALIDLDGVTENGIVRADKDNFLGTVGAATLQIVGPLSDAFDGQMFIGHRDTIQFSESWVLGGRVIFQGGQGQDLATLIGPGITTDPLNAATFVIESGRANIAVPLQIDSGSFTAVNGTTVDFNAPTTFGRGVSFGTGSQGITFNVNRDVRIDDQNLSPLDGTVWNVGHDRLLHFDGDHRGDFNGRINLSQGSTLTLNGDFEFAADSILNMATAGATLNIGGVTHLKADVDLDGNGPFNTVNVQTGAELRLSGKIATNTENRFHGDFDIGGVLHVDVPGDSWTLGNGGKLRLEGGTGSPEVRGKTIVNEGLIFGEGRFTVNSENGFNGRIAPGDGDTTGRLEWIDADLELVTNSTTAFDIGGRSFGTTYDRIDARSVFLQGGDLELGLFNGFLPQPSDVFTIISANLLSGEFVNVAPGARLSTTDGLGSFRVDYGTGSRFDPSLVVLSDFVAGLLTGDYNGSGQVEQGDLDLLLQNWGVDTDLAGIPSGWVNDLPVGLIEQTELDGVLQNWGSSAAPDFRGNAVPEPGPVGLIGMAMLALTGRRFRERERSLIDPARTVKTPPAVGHGCAVRPTPWGCFVTLLAVSMTTAATTHAQINYFWNDPNGGAFSEAGNWISPFPGTSPALASRAIFDLPSGYTVTYPTSPSGGTIASVRGGNVTFDLQGNAYSLGDLFVGESADHVAELKIIDGRLNPGTTTLGEASPSSGTVIVGSGGRFEPNAFKVGNHGTGSLIIQQGGRTDASATRVGNELTGSGIIRVSGTNGAGNRSTFTEAGHLIVGTQGHGELHITGGGLVETHPNTAAEQHDHIALFPGPGGGLGATGLVVIDGVTSDGTPSTWTSTGALLMGNVAGSGAVARGTMTITDGGQATHSQARLLGSTDLPSRVEIRGTDAANNPARWTLVSGSLGLSNGEIEVSEGGAFEPTKGVSLGELDGYGGRMTITGSSSNGVRSSYTGSGFTVGQDGDGELNVTDGATLSATGITGNMTLGSNSTSHGTALISGKDAFGNAATVTMGRNIVVGLEGSASLTVSDGGVLTTGFDEPQSYGLVATRDTSDSVSVLITGEGSSWTHANNLYVGGSAATAGGFATMSIDDRAAVDIGRTLKVWNTNKLEVLGGTLSADVLELTAGSRLNFGIAGTQPSGDHGQVLLSDDALLDGLLNVALLDGFVPAASDTFTLLDAVDVMGVFENASPGERLTTSGGGGSFVVNYGAGSAFAANRVVLSNFLAQAVTSGDYNGSGQIEQGDLDLVLQNWGLDIDVNGVPAGWVNDLPAGLIEQSELDGVLQNWGGTGTPDFSGSHIPEPISLGLVAIGGMTLLRRQPEQS